MDLGGPSDLNMSERQLYLGGMNFPADKQEVASGVESNGAPKAVVTQIRNSANRALRQPGEGAAGGARELGGSDRGGYLASSYMPW